MEKQIEHKYNTQWVLSLLTRDVYHIGDTESENVANYIFDTLLELDLIKVEKLTDDPRSAE